ncbi:serpin family protein [Novosphingobium sp. JCM 18896]|nr:serpin family protein [Novosphingobium sp. JCM 18896]MCW1428774.1 serpin family protein [Novosphingobium sp. JCM 18896]
MMSMRARVLTALAATLASQPLAAQSPEPAVDEIPAPVRHVPLAAPLDAEAQAAVAGINAFSLDLYRRTLKTGENHFLSPASVSVAVGLAYRGARGETAAELERVLRFGQPPREYLRANAQILASMNFVGEGRELRTGNAIWLQDGISLLPEYEADMARFADAGLQRVDFQKNAETARTRINGWVEDRTRGKIRDLLLSPDVTDGTRAILVNTIYWKGLWAQGFDAAATKSQVFETLAGEKPVIPLMTQRASFQIVERKGIKAILLPYQGREIEMAVFVPNSREALPRFEAELTSEELTRWLGDLQGGDFRDTILTLPKMRVEWRQDLVDTLKEVGATTAFSDRADFSGMTSFPLPHEPESAGLKIRKVIHQAYLDVDEAGSEAAAATAVIMDIVTSGRRGPPPPPPFIFRADKPFLFLLRDRRTGLILFMGRYVAPSAG